MNYTYLEYYYKIKYCSNFYGEKILNIELLCTEDYSAIKLNWNKNITKCGSRSDHCAKIQLRHHLFFFLMFISYHGCDHL